MRAQKVCSHLGTSAGKQYFASVKTIFSRAAAGMKGQEEKGTDGEL